MKQPKAQITKTLPSPAIAPRELTAIPDSVREHFAAQGRNVVLASGDPKMAIQLATIHMEMVFPDDLSAEVLRDLKRNQFTVTPDGLLRRADAVLYSQTEQARAYFEEQAMLQAMRNSGQVEAAEAGVYEELNRKAGQRGFVVQQQIARSIPLPG